MMQCVAWAGMLWDYSEKEGLIRGARDTFSGDRPCELCEAIAELKQDASEGKEETPQSLAERFSFKDLKCPERLALKQPRSRELAKTVPVEPAEPHASWLEGPLLPPPRIAV